MTAHPAPTEDRTDVLGRRIGAALLDLVLLVIVGIVIGILVGDTDTEGARVSVTLGTGGTLLLLAVSLAYYGIAEGLTGQTLGKKALGVRVARLDGGGAGAGAIVARTLLRVVDGILFYLVGLIAILATGQRRQRIGDLAGGTTVVRA